MSGICGLYVFSFILNSAPLLPIDYIKNIGYNKIQEIEKEVTSYARQELSKLEYLTLYLTPNEEKHSSVISFNIKGVHPHDVASILDSENVCVRSGNHCAQPLLRSMGIDSTCRASFYIYNTKEDVDKLVHALNKAYNMFKNYITKNNNFSTPPKKTNKLKLKK